MQNDPHDITNRMLLEHMQAMKEELTGQIRHVTMRLDKLETRVERGFQETERSFQEAKEHREALQEDLEETILKLDRVQENYGHRIVRLEERTGLMPAA